MKNKQNSIITSSKALEDAKKLVQTKKKMCA